MYFTIFKIIIETISAIFIIYVTMNNDNIPKILILISVFLLTKNVFRLISLILQYLLKEKNDDKSVS